MENQKSAIGLDGNIAAALGYPIGIIALILIFMEKENKFVRFHAIQSLLWSLVMTIVVIIIAVIGTILALIVASASSNLAVVFGIIVTLVYLVWLVAFLGGLIYAAIKAYGNNKTKLPIVGGFAEKWSS
jgi:uncharacterized membrane protein